MLDVSPSMLFLFRFFAYACFNYERHWEPKLFIHNPPSWFWLIWMDLKRELLLSLEQVGKFHFLKEISIGTTDGNTRRCKKLCQWAADLETRKWRTVAVYILWLYLWSLKEMLQRMVEGYLLKISHAHTSACPYELSYFTLNDSILSTINLDRINSFKGENNL